MYLKLLSPLLEFKRNKDLTRNDEVIEETKQDGLMLRKVTYKWYNNLWETMKDTVQHFKDIQSMPTLLMYGTEDKLLELRSFNELKNNLNTNEFYFKVWEGS